MSEILAIHNGMECSKAMLDFMAKMSGIPFSENIRWCASFGWGLDFEYDIYLDLYFHENFNFYFEYDYNFYFEYDLNLDFYLDLLNDLMEMCGVDIRSDEYKETYKYE